MSPFASPGGKLVVQTQGGGGRASGCTINPKEMGPRVDDRWRHPPLPGFSPLAAGPPPRATNELAVKTVSLGALGGFAAVQIIAIAIAGLEACWSRSTSPAIFFLRSGSPVGSSAPTTRRTSAGGIGNTMKTLERVGNDGDRGGCLG